MGIRVTCPNCNKQLNVKSFLAGKRGVCPECKTKFDIPAGSEHNVVLEVEDVEPSLDLRHVERPREPAPVYAPVAPQAPVFPQVAPAAPYAGSAPPASYPFPAAVPAAAVATVAAVGLPAAGPVSPPMVAPYAAAPADPIAEAPHASWHICSATGERYGPVLGQVLRQWITERRLAADSLIWRDGWAQWQRADQVFVELSPIPPVAVVAAPMMVGIAPQAAMFPAAEASVPVDAFPSAPVRPTFSRSYGRRSDNSMRTLVLVLLVLAVLILAPLLGYVLMRQF